MKEMSFGPPLLNSKCQLLVSGAFLSPYKMKVPLALPHPGTHSAVPAQMIYLFEGNKNKRKKKNGLAKRFERVKNPAATKKAHQLQARRGKAG